MTGISRFPSRKIAVLAMLACSISTPSYGSPESRHDTSWWQSVAAHDFAPPAEVPLDSLLQELSGYMASTDPVLRDEIGYGVLTQWLYVKRIVPPDLRRSLIDEWSANLTKGIGEQGTDSVFRRSFSALMLSVAVALDNESPYLDREEFDGLLESALAYLRDERDVRGFDPDRGWIHSVAHTADLLKFLGRSRHLEPAGQDGILRAIAAKLDDLDWVLTHGEDERLARVVVALAARPDFSEAALADFLHELKPLNEEGAPTSAVLAVNQNRKHLAVSLYALLEIGGGELDSLRRARESVRTLLATMM